MSIEQSRAAVAQLLNGFDSDKQFHLVTASAIEGTALTRVYGRLDRRANSTLSAVEATQVIRKSLGGKVQAVADTFTVLASDQISDLVTGLIMPLRVSKPFTEGEEGMRVMAGNMFMDQEENLWKLQKTEAGQLLIRSELDNLEEIQGMMASLCSGVGAGIVAANEAWVQQHYAAVNRIGGGADILYVDPETFAVTAATVIAEIEEDANSVAIAGADGISSITRDLIVCEASFDGLTDGEEEATAASIDDIADYYRRVFQRRPEYFEEFMSRWRSHFAVA